jgi:hypothetical protein
MRPAADVLRVLWLKGRRPALKGETSWVKGKDAVMGELNELLSGIQSDVEYLRRCL